MDLFEFETEEELTREEAAARLRAIADELERHNELRVKVGGLPITIEVPKQVTFELEIDVEDDESEIEITISW
jgi:amphi-Trp domain-containing protein